MRIQITEVIFCPEGKNQANPKLVTAVSKLHLSQGEKKVTNCKIEF